MKIEKPCLNQPFITDIPISNLLLLQAWIWLQNRDDIHLTCYGIDPDRKLFGY